MFQQLGAADRQYRRRSNIVSFFSCSFEGSGFDARAAALR